MLNQDTHYEFAPGDADAAMAGFDRRTFLKLMGASLAAAGAACSRPQPLERIVPYVKSPENVLPGVPSFYASVLPTRGLACGFGRGIVVESHEGRPTKVEGNPQHPSSLGGTDIFMQASVLQLYDPDRSRMPRRGGQLFTWERCWRDLSSFIQARGGPGRVRAALLTPPLTSPTLLDQIAALRRALPACRWHIDQTLGGMHSAEGQRRALGRRATLLYDFSQAARIVSFDSHFLAEEPGSLRYARDYIHRRRTPWHDIGPNRTHVESPLPTASADLARLYVAETSLTFTGAMADHRLGIAPGQMVDLFHAFAAAVLGMPAPAAHLDDASVAWAKAAAADLLAHSGAALVLVGDYQPPEIHAVAHALNARLGALGKTVRLMEPVDALPDEDASLASLSENLQRGDLDLLVMLDVNPSFTAPADLQFAQRLAGFARDGNRLALHIGGWVDETAALCTHHLPLAHALESWGDLRAHDGTAGIVQPLIEPLWEGRAAVEIIAFLHAAASGLPLSRLATAYDLVHDRWLAAWKGDPAPERRWREALRSGMIADTAAGSVDARPADAQALLEALAAARTRVPADAIEIVFRPDPTLADGTWANNPWLQELPKPISRVTWDNAGLIGPATARRLGIMPAGAREESQSVRISDGSTAVEVPVRVVPGVPEGTVTLHLGGGRRSGGSVQEGAGVDVYPLRQSRTPWQRTDLHVEPGRQKFKTPATQAALSMADRDVARVRRAGEQRPSEPRSTGDSGALVVSLSLYPEYPYRGYRWGMVIDLSACMACNACVIACQAENNIPVVGRDQVWRGREMHWLRIDTYLAPAEAGDPEQFRFQPMLCQHCENAPCEVVCPVEATSHSAEGLNEMTYNRCVGTRYCSNNCPYKVRRFNFLNFSRGASYGVPDDDRFLYAMQKNPNVTVRSRGVMEKCTYCVQRINRARIDAKRDWARHVSDPALHPQPEMRAAGRGAEELPRLRFQTACQQACPTEAIVFGDLNDTDAVATMLKTRLPWSGLNYGVLTELNTQPRTSYLERVINPNPDLRGGAA